MKPTAISTRIGQPGRSSHHDDSDWSGTPQSTVLTFAGVTDTSGDYTVSIEPDSRSPFHPASFDVTHTSPGSETSAEIATAVAAALLDHPATSQLIASISDDEAGELTVTFERGRYTVSTTVAGGTATVSTTPATGLEHDHAAALASGRMTEHTSPPDPAEAASHAGRIAARRARRQGIIRQPVRIPREDGSVITTAPLDHPLSEADAAYVQRLRAGEDS